MGAEKFGGGGVGWNTGVARRCLFFGGATYKEVRVYRDAASPKGDQQHGRLFWSFSLMAGNGFAVVNQVATNLHGCPPSEEHGLPGPSPPPPPPPLSGATLIRGRVVRLPLLVPIQKGTLLIARLSPLFCS